MWGGRIVSNSTYTEVSVVPNHSGPKLGSGPAFSLPTSPNQQTRRGVDRCSQSRGSARRPLDASCRMEYYGSGLSTTACPGLGWIAVETNYLSRFRTISAPSSPYPYYPKQHDPPPTRSPSDRPLSP
jgi:hypothetical protein